MNYTTKKEFDKLKQNINNWLITVRKDQSKFQNLPTMVKENQENTDFNYELIMELSEKIEELDESVHALKVIELIKMKKNEKKK